MMQHYCMYVLLWYFQSKQPRPVYTHFYAPTLTLAPRCPEEMLIC